MCSDLIFWSYTLTDYFYQENSESIFQFFSPLWFTQSYSIESGIELCVENFSTIH